MPNLTPEILKDYWIACQGVLLPSGYKIRVDVHIDDSGRVVIVGHNSPTCCGCVNVWLWPSRIEFAITKKGGRPMDLVTDIFCAVAAHLKKKLPRT